MMPRLRRMLRDERGTLIEIPLLIAYVMLSLALIPAYHSVWKAFVFGALFFVGGLTALVGLGMLLDKFSDLAALKAVQRVLESRPLRLLAAAVSYLVGGVACGVIAAFVSIFIAPHVSSTAGGQLLAMRAVAASGALGGFWIVYALRHEAPRF